MINIKSVKNAEHYTWGDNCDGWHLLKTDELSVIQEKMPLNTNEKLHMHLHAQQVFYILAGVATFEIDDQVIVVNANESIHIPKQIKHRICNLGDIVLEFIVVSLPKSHGDRQEI